MNLASILVLSAVLAAAVAAVAFMVHRRRTIGSSACGACALRNICKK